MLTMKSKIKRVLKTEQIDEDLLKLYNNPDGQSLSEFKEDSKLITTLQRMMRKLIRGYEKQIFYELRNIYIVLRNVFGLSGIDYIAVYYFSESDKMFEYFCSLPYYFDEIKISNRRSTYFIRWLELNDTLKRRIT